MSIFAISDLHLSLSSDKPMDVFSGWENHTERIRANWERLVKDSDTVVLPGDLSWALKLDEVYDDMAFLNSLPGKKLILKGNHDLWWGTMKKLNSFLTENGFDTVLPIFNSAAEVEDRAVCGTRGWDYDSPVSDVNIVLREAARLDTSLKAEMTGKEPLVFLHFPPAYKDFVCREMIDVLHAHGIKRVYHGHIHGVGRINALREFEGIELRLVSCDCVDFTPVMTDQHQNI